MLLGHNVGRATVVNAAVYRSTLHFLLRALLLGPFTSWNRYKGRGGGGGKPSIEWADYRNLNFQSGKTKNLGLRIHLRES